MSVFSRFPDISASLRFGVEGGSLHADHCGAGRADPGGPVGFSVDPRSIGFIRVIETVRSTDAVPRIGPFIPNQSPETVLCTAREATACAT